MSLKAQVMVQRQRLSFFPLTLGVQIRYGHINYIKLWVKCRQRITIRGYASTVSYVAGCAVIQWLGKTVGHNIPLAPKLLT